jgi:hypothetical protein
LDHADYWEWFLLHRLFPAFQLCREHLGDAYPDYAASVLGGNDFMRSSFGVGFPLFASVMYYRLGIGWVYSLLGFLSIAFIPIPFALYFLGERIRRASKRARHDLRYYRLKLDFAQVRHLVGIKVDEFISIHTVSRFTLLLIPLPTVHNVLRYTILN